MYKIKEETSIDMYLPWPPSINHYYGDRVIQKGGKYITIKYITAKGKKYREDVSNQLTRAVKHHCKKHFTKDVRLKMDIVVVSPDRRKRDVDNLLKASVDAMMHAGVFPDDSQIDDLHIVRDRENIQKPGALIVRISVIEKEV